MNFTLLFHTLTYLKGSQIVYQIKNRLFNPKFKSYIAPLNAGKLKMNFFIPKYTSRLEKTFVFLNIRSSFIAWDNKDNGMLWTYNLNYMDWLLQEEATCEEGIKWIDKFIKDFSINRVGLDPYPIALRGINWIKFITLHEKHLTAEQTKRWNDSLFSQYQLLTNKLEFHLLGNHLLEDLYSLLIAAIYFKDRKLYNKASRLLIKELDEEILNDGAHYEQSPMYHCILLDRLLDCYNFSKNNSYFTDQDSLTDFLREKAEKMLGHLECMIYADKTFPLFNDSAFKVAPTVKEIFQYAQRLGVQWKRIKLYECGYRHLSSDSLEAFVDVGNITASYQPGHSHADTFNYELRVNGNPFIVDTGISTYDKTARRQLERSTIAHNTVSLGGLDSSQVWGGFRVGKRARVKLLRDDKKQIIASHNGFGKADIHTRSFILIDDVFEIEDTISTHNQARNYIHLAPDVQILSCTDTEIRTSIANIRIEGADWIECLDGAVSTEYNTLVSSQIVIIHFSRSLKYKISPI